MKRNLYVSPTGACGWTGRYPEPTADGLDGPIPVPQMALRMARQWHSTGAADGPVTVWLEDGRYPITFPMEFGPEDYGIIEFKARPGARPIIDGGVRVTDWQETTVNGMPAWTADVSAHLLEFGPFRSLFVNGERRERSRYPSDDYLWIEEAPDQPAEMSAQTTNMDLLRGGYRFRAAYGDLEPITRWDGAEVIMFNRWINERMPVASYDAQSRMLSMDIRTRLFLRTEYAEKGKTLRYYIENVPQGLLKPGNWYLDESTRTVTYLPCADESPDTVEVVVPAVKQFVRIKGDLATQTPAGGISFEGITFAYADWSLPCNKPVWWDPYTPESSWRPRASFRHFVEINNANPRIDTGSTPQAAANLPGVIDMECTRDVAVTDCHIAHAGFYGIGVGEACSTIRIVGNEIEDMGAGGVILDGTDPQGDPRKLTGQCCITDNHIHGGGHVFRAACGVTAVHTARNVIAYNHIHDMTYSGISCGWMWGLCDSVSVLHWIYKNHIHDLGQRGGMSDMGGIYLLGPQPGTFVEGNFIHDVTSAAYGGWGIYPDEGSSFLTIENNVVMRTGSQSLHEHMGRQNVIRNNMFLLGEGGAAFSRNIRNRWNAFPTEGGMFFRNIIVTDDGHALRELLAYQERNPYDCEMNVYWDRSRPEPVFRVLPREKFVQESYEYEERSFSDRQASGLDHSSRVEDPLIKDLDAGDIALDAASPALAMGFRPIRLDDVGPRPPEARVIEHVPEPYLER